MISKKQLKEDIITYDIITYKDEDRCLYGC